MPAERDTEPEKATVVLARTAMERGVGAMAVQDIETALRWLERAHRLVPHDLNTQLTLATACLSCDPQRAEALFADVARRYDVRQAWLGIAAVRLRMIGPDAAAEPLGAVLSRHAVTTETAALAAKIAGRDGWCGLRPDGVLELHPAGCGRVQVTQDGRRVHGMKLSGRWAQAHRVEVRRGDSHLLGSPIRIDAIRRLDGCVETWRGGLRGWAWHPGDPETAPTLTLTYADGSTQTLVARDESRTVPHIGPLARPRSFYLTQDDLQGPPGPVRVTGPDGNDILGSPLDPFADCVAHVLAARCIAANYPSGPVRCVDNAAIPYPQLRADIPSPVRPVGAERRRRATTVVIPVHNGGAVALACLASVLAAGPEQPRILVVDDGSSDPATVDGLDTLHRQRRIGLLRHRRAQGFPSAANAGIRAAKARDVVLLNSDTLVPPGWLTRLRDAAYGAPDIGTVTPLSNDATILSYPGPPGTNPKPDQAATNRLDRLARRANANAVVDIPVGVGFCLYLRRDCLNAVGAFRADLFAQGYGEENDLSMRARHLGWRNVALTGLFVGHCGGASFGASGNHLRRRNNCLIEELHPGHQALIERFVAADPLAEPRRRIDLVAWKQRSSKSRHAVILLTHNEGGGVERRVKLSASAHAEAGRRPILLRPAETPGGERAVAVRDGFADDLPNLIFAIPREIPLLQRMLRRAKADRVEIHHLAHHAPSIYDLIAQLGLPYEVHIHDYAWFCPRVALVAAQNRYCGEPDLLTCEACIADNGHFLREKITVAELRRRSADFLAGACRVVVPAEDVGLRMRRHFTMLSPETVPHDDDASAIAAGAGRHARSSNGRHGRPRVCVVGAIGVHKGYEVLLACARDADRRDLDLEFIVVGHTIEDDRIMQTGRVFVTGQFDPDEAVDLIAAQHAQFGFVPSICPETWCLGLGQLWQAGLSAAAFDIGAPAERIRRTQRGIVLPLGIPANAINNRLVAAIRAARR